MKTGRPGKKIMCVNDGKIYQSLESAANSYNTTRSAISKHINGHRKSVKGLYFIEVTGTESLQELEHLRLQFIIKSCHFNL